jgi:hypothetical protein
MLRRVRLHHFRHRECLTVPDELTYGRALVVVFDSPFDGPL